MAAQILESLEKADKEAPTRPLRQRHSTIVVPAVRRSTIAANSEMPLQVPLSPLADQGHDVQQAHQSRQAEQGQHGQQAQQTLAAAPPRPKVLRVKSSPQVPFRLQRRSAVGAKEAKSAAACAASEIHTLNDRLLNERIKAVRYHAQTQRIEVTLPTAEGVVNSMLFDKITSKEMRDDGRGRRQRSKKFLVVQQDGTAKGKICRPNAVSDDAPEFMHGRFHQQLWSASTDAQLKKNICIEPSAIRGAGVTSEELSLQAALAKKFKPPARGKAPTSTSGCRPAAKSRASAATSGSIDTFGGIADSDSGFGSCASTCNLGSAAAGSQSLSRYQSISRELYLKYM